MIINLGDAPFKGFIRVTYPNGTCTVSLGDKSFTHSGGGTHTFTVNKKGTWTVTCTSNDGYNTKATSTVALTYRGQVASVTLSYSLWLYNKGDLCTAVTGGWTGYTGHSGGELRADAVGQDNGGRYASTAKAINFGPYKTLNMHITSSAQGDANTKPNFGVRQGVAGTWTERLIWDAASNETKSLAITSTSGNVSFGAGGFKNEWGVGYAGYCRIDQCWLTM